jgi:hypothetical protein
MVDGDAAVEARPIEPSNSLESGSHFAPTQPAENNVSPQHRELSVRSEPGGVDNRHTAVLKA